jgi:hypothetical protein
MFDESETTRCIYHADRRAESSLGGEVIFFATSLSRVEVIGSAAVPVLVT